jgi:flagellar hook protein FlgE
MSITSALSIATSGLQAQSQAFTSISSNIANVSTIGYKASDTSFSALLTETSSTTASGVGGVVATTSQGISNSGDIESTGVSTELAISGSGFFAVTGETDASEVYYTRDGTFSVDDSGYLVNDNGYYLNGWELDENGDVIASNRSSTQSLEPINLSDISGIPEATSNLEIVATVPADAEVNESFVSDTEIYDSLGTSHTVELTWTKTDTNTWTVTASDPTLASDTSETSGTSGGEVITVTFNTDGSLASVSSSTGADPVSFSFSGWTSGAADSTVTLDLGTVGKTDGLKQASSDDGNPQLSVTRTTQDGWSAGTLESVSIGSDGTVTANFDNGQSRAVYKIPVVTFSNPDGLASVSGTVYSATVNSGQYQLKEGGSDGAGSIQSEALEQSTADTATELTRMIYAQQAYSAAAKVVTAAQEMMDTLISAKR